MSKQVKRLVGEVGEAVAIVGVMLGYVVAGILALAVVIFSIGFAAMLAVRALGALGAVA